MKVVYNTIVDDIDDIISQAKLEKRTIKEIRVTYDEWREYMKVRNLTPNPDWFNDDHTPIASDLLADHKGVNLVLER